MEQSLGKIVIESLPVGIDGQIFSILCKVLYPYVSYVLREATFRITFAENTYLIRWHTFLQQSGSYHFGSVIGINIVPGQTFLLNL